MYIELKKGRLVRIDVEEIRDVWCASNFNNAWCFNIKLIDGDIISVDYDTEQECIESVNKIKRYAQNSDLFFE